MFNSIQLKQKLSQVILNWDIPGCAVGVSENNSIIFELYNGKKAIDCEEKIDENTQFCVASIGKVFVAIAILHLHETGIIDINNTVESYIPYFRMKDKKYKEITIEMLLSHTSGLPDLTMDEYMRILNNDKETYKDYISSFYNKILEEPGSKFIYSNYGYSVLAEVISIVSNKSFNKFMKSEIFEKVGMHHSYFDFPPDLKKVAYPHLRIPEIIKSEKYPYSLVDAPASFMHTTVRDILAFYENIHKLISKEIFQRMVYPKSIREYPPFYKASGLGINIGEFNNNLVYSHGGMGFGFTGFYMIFPELKTSAIVLCNEESYAHENLYHLIAEAITDVPLKIEKTSWVIPLGKMFGIDEVEKTLKEAKLMLVNKKYTTHKDELKNIMYQIIVAGKKERFFEFTQLYLDLYPNDEEVANLLENIKKHPQFT